MKGKFYMVINDIVNVMFAGDSPSPIDNLIKCGFGSRTSYRVAKTYKRIAAEFELYQEQVRKIYEKYGTADADGRYRFEGDAVRAVNGEIAELMSTDITDFPEEKIQIKLTDNLKLAAKDIILLEPFFDFVEEGD